ncbi:YybH family protein [Bacteroidota bacterium]
MNKQALHLFGAIVIFFLFSLISCNHSSENNKTTKLSESDHQAIDDLRTKLVNAILDGDADAYADLCTEDVHLLHPNTPLVTSRNALRQQEARVFEIVNVSKLVLTPVDTYVKGDLAYEIGTQIVAIEPSDERFLGNRKYTHVMKKEEDGQWRFAVLMSNNSQ